MEPQIIEIGMYVPHTLRLIVITVFKPFAKGLELEKKKDWTS